MDDLERARQKFVHWRANKKQLGRTVPKSLWQLACELTKHYPIPRVASVLGVGNGALRERAWRFMQPAEGADLNRRPLNEPSPRVVVTPFRVEEQPAAVKAPATVDHIEIALRNLLVLRLPVTISPQYLKAVLSVTMEVL